MDSVTSGLAFLRNIPASLENDTWGDNNTGVVKFAKQEIAARFVSIAIVPSTAAAQAVGYVGATFFALVATGARKVVELTSKKEWLKEWDLEVVKEYARRIFAYLTLATSVSIAVFQGAKAQRELMNTLGIHYVKPIKVDTREGEPASAPAAASSADAGAASPMNTTTETLAPAPSPQASAPAPISTAPEKREVTYFSDRYNSLVNKGNAYTLKLTDEEYSKFISADQKGKQELKVSIESNKDRKAADMVQLDRKKADLLKKDYDAANARIEADKKAAEKAKKEASKQPAPKAVLVK